MTSDVLFATVRQLAEYEVWCNARALDAAAGLTREELYREFPFGLKTIHRTLWHVVEVFEHWSGWVEPEIDDRWWRDYRPDASVAELRQLSDALGAAFLEAADASHARGLLHQDRRLAQLFHLVTHGTHHRTQFITMLRLLGKDPPFEAGDFGGWQAERDTGPEGAA